MNILKKSLLILAGAATLAVAGTASAQDYAMCTYKGLSTLTSGSLTATCWTTLTTKIDCAGNVRIVAVGAIPDDTNPDLNCYGIGTGDLPWTTTAAGIIAGSSINTDGSGFGLPSVISMASGSPLAAGVLNGVGPAPSTVAVACDTSSPTSTVTVPTLVPVDGAFSSGATFVSDPGLALKGCSL